MIANPYNYTDTLKFFLVSKQWRRRAVKEPDHFEVRKSSSQVTRMHFFPQKSRRPFLVVALKTQRPPTPFHRQNKTNKAIRYGNIFIFLFTL